MRYFIDTEFIEAGPNHPIELLSCGVVAEDGRWYYMENAEADLSNASEWVKQYILPQFHHEDACNYDDLRLNLLNMTRDDPAPEFWGWCCDFDYVVISQAVGFTNWPENWPYYFRDIQQVIDETGADISEVQRTGNHNDLEDAREIKRIWEYLNERAA